MMARVSDESPPALTVPMSQVLREARMKSLLSAGGIAAIWGIGYDFSMTDWPMWVGAMALAAGGPWLSEFYVRYIAAPFQIHRTFRSPVVRQFVPFDPDDSSVLREARQAIAETMEGMAALDFLLHGHFWSEGTVMSTGGGHLTLWENVRNGDEGRLLTSSARSTRPLPDGRVVESSKISTTLVFTTRFADGTKVVTANTRTGGNFRRNPNRLSLNYPDIRDPLRLYRIHRRAVEEFGSLARVEKPQITEPNAYLTGTVQEEWQRQIDGGEVYIYESDQTYRPTWKGAVCMGMRLQWPWRHLRRWSLHRRSQRFLKRFPELTE